MSNNFIVTNHEINNIHYYGLEIKTDDGDTYNYDFISPSKAETVKLADRMSESDISPTHFRDIIRDYLTELYLTAMEENGLAVANI